MTYILYFNIFQLYIKLTDDFNKVLDGRTVPPTATMDTFRRGFGANVVMRMGTQQILIKLGVGCSPCMQEVKGSTPTGGTCPNDFSDPIDQDIRTQWALSWKIEDIYFFLGEY